MSLWKILGFVALALVAIFLFAVWAAKFIPDWKEKYDREQKTDFQKEALVFHAEVAEPIALRMVELARPYTSPPFPSSTSTRELSSELGGPSAIVYFVVEEEMPAWARDELRRRGEPITSDSVFHLLQATPAWKEMVGLYDLFHVSENLPESVERRGTSLQRAREWLAELRATAVQLQILEEDRVVSR